MNNPKIARPNFVLLREDSTGGIFIVTVCVRTLHVLDEEVYTDLPNGWTEKDYHDLLDEGRRFFS